MDADAVTVGPQTHTPAAARPAGDTAGRCPHCSGAVKPDAPWCTQCWADLRPAPEPTLASPGLPGLPGRPGLHVVPGEPREPAGIAAGTAVRPAARGWPCAGCGTVNAVEHDACVACGMGFLAGMRQHDPPLLVLPGVGDIAKLSRGQRLGLAGGVVLVVVMLVVLLGLLTG